MFINRIENPILRTLVEWLFAVGFAIILFFLVRTFIFRVARVDGNSMSPTLVHGDMVVLSRFLYLFTAPRAGDIVAFPYQGDPSEYYIKRVIAVPGDIVDLRYGEFFINGERLDDAFAVEPIRAMGDVGFPIVIEEELFFVLGDNRNGSRDSRNATVGNVPARDMIGQVVVRIWPLDRLGRVD